MPTAAKSKRRVARGCAIGGAELRLKGLKKSDRRHGGASLVRCRKFRPVAGGLYRSLTGYVVKIKTDAGKIRFIGPRGVARLQSRAKRFDTQSEAKQAAESTIARGYGKIRSAAVVKVVAGAKKASGRKSVKNGRGTGHRYEVIVGNIGTVYDGASMSAASETYRDYVMMSKSERGRAGGESVTMLKDGDIAREHAGSSEDY